MILFASSSRVNSTMIDNTDFVGAILDSHPIYLMSASRRRLAGTITPFPIWQLFTSAIMRERTLERAAELQQLQQLDKPQPWENVAILWYLSVQRTPLPESPGKNSGRHGWGKSRYLDVMSNPWDFYEPFLKLSSGLLLVLCRSGTENSGNKDLWYRVSRGYLLFSWNPASKFR